MILMKSTTGFMEHERTREFLNWPKVPSESVEEQIDVELLL